MFRNALRSVIVLPLEISMDKDTMDTVSVLPNYLVLLSPPWVLWITFRGVMVLPPKP
jgi:hypothetical protein